MPAVPEGWVEEYLNRGVIWGKPFGDDGEGYARISYAAGIEVLKTALEIMDDAASGVG